MFDIYDGLSSATFANGDFILILEWNTLYAVRYGKFKYMNFDDPFGNYKCELFNILTLRNIYRGSALEYVDDLVATADDWRISSIIPLDCNVQVLYAAYSMLGEIQ